MLMAHALGSQLNSKLSVRRTFCSDVKIVRMFHKSQGLLLMIVQM